MTCTDSKFLSLINKRFIVKQDNDFTDISFVENIYIGSKPINYNVFILRKEVRLINC